MPVPSAYRAHDLLRAAGATLATAESLTGGQLAAALTNVPGASATYAGGVVSYATDLKKSLLGVTDDIVAGPGVVSAECAEAMAVGTLRITGATYALSTTGVAGPEPQENKPVGLVYVGVAGPDLLRSVKLQLSGDRAAIQEATCEEALAALVAVLPREEPRVG